MELTLKIPKRLVFRLRPHERQLDKILELGLDAFEAADQIAIDTEEEALFEDDIPASWRQAAQSFSERLTETSDLPAPTPAELTAYLEGDLGAAEADSLRGRLLQHPKAIEELLVMEDPGLDSMGLGRKADAEFDDSEVRQAWDQLQVRLAAQEAPISESEPESQSEAPSPFESHVTPESARSQPRRFTRARLRPWLSLAAGVLLTTLSFGASSVYHGRQATAPQITHEIELKVNRGSGRLFTIQPNVDQVMLRLPRPASTLNQGPRHLEVFSPDGRSILSRRIEGWAQGGNSLHLILPRQQLAAGDYLLVIRDPGAEAVEPQEEYAFSLDMP